MSIIISRSRTSFKRIGANAIRREGKIPAVVQMGNRENLNITIDDTNEFQSILSRSKDNLYDLSIDGEAGFKVILKEVQRHPISNKLLHVDFSICTGG